MIRKAQFGIALSALLLILTTVSSGVAPVKAIPAPDLSIEGTLLFYFGAVFLIYPTPEPQIYYRINVTVANLGRGDAGRFNVSLTVYLEGAIMPQHGRKTTFAGLEQGVNSTFTWDFDPQNYGLYTLVLTADCDYDIIESDETNNVKTRDVRGTIRGDCNGDGHVDGIDFGILAPIYGSIFGQPGYHPECDFNIDGKVDGVDFGFFAPNYGSYI